MTLNAAQVAKLVGTTRQTVINDIASGKLKATRSGRNWIVSTQAAMAYVRAWDKKREDERKSLEEEQKKMREELERMRKEGGK